MAARPLDMKMLRPKANSLGNGYERCDDYACSRTGQSFVDRSMRGLATPSIMTNGSICGRRRVHSRHTLHRRPHEERTGLALHRPLFLINALDEPYEDRIGLLMNALRVPVWLTEVSQISKHRVNVPSHPFDQPRSLLRTAVNPSHCELALLLKVASPQQWLDIIYAPLCTCEGDADPT
ncbi:hypothetical protein PUNSTDRAFT_130511 [Punctularia strigosozonata HHB-11173 SS5]|uniref:uncharacterized protein n=1 Tax=Punctularia strigosozonata (strain HHB-11173) TaxID=741275 RepID=UPI00044164F6|nr:uncharacterized protein PUNSTDRAFT_130511 [Punctularia strigosozonata HHB-11173 SS5]EIN12245.1 hypothetical protein PUNSTDRAFT_130511 [Punctularia strigosozonata HHB-11173 SS5]